ncbi:MAG: peptide chain release factor N(5)-glutamine methyltransferase [Clostridiales bacterium]|nr:peptide chain release factor N(5)-glutamine methyltransferase [Clostridiales bacterium]
MSLRTLYEQSKQRLEESGCDSPAFDASCLLEAFCGVARGRLAMEGGRTAAADQYRRLWTAVEERAAGRPLQYILGEWDFLDLTLSVGEGVLIPRPDTELLCETAAELLKKTPCTTPLVLDLCAGSGCVALGVARLLPGASAVAVELSKQALPYLRRNIARYPALSVTAVQGDVLAFDDRSTSCEVLRPDSAAFDAVVSNPPYIPASELSSLMREVQREPVMALDGGDGLRFYRAITGEWLSRLKPGGFCAVEVGIYQAAQVASLFQAAGLEEIIVRRDLNGVERVVCGRKNGAFQRKG